MTGALARPEDISNLPREQRGEVITRALEESKSWLAVATQGTDPTPIAEFKAWAATVAEMTKQKGLAQDIQLDALEMVRRAERGIHLSVEKARDSGELLRVGQTKRRPGHAVGGADRMKTLAELGLKRDSLSETAALARGVSDEEFEEAISEARDDGDLSRANVSRKLKGLTGGGISRAEKATKIRELAAAGYTSKQMVAPLSTGDDTIRDIAREHGIDIPADKFTARTKGHSLDPVRVVQGTVDAVYGIEYGINQLASADFDAITPDQARAWLGAMETPMRALRALHKELSARAREAH